MTDELRPVKGSHDLLVSGYKKHDNIIDAASDIGRVYGFKGFSTPIFEYTDVFKRTLGETSDVVNKEMFTFETRGGESITLRPEFTAGIARAFISNGLKQNLPLKLFSYGPVFRYERPQKGRQRQFHQVNFEWLGNDSPLADVELIALAQQILDELKIQGKVSLELNTLGDNDSRAAYRDALVGYLEKYKDDLSEDSRTRLEKNPLRILDSKDEADRRIIKDAPVMSDYLNKHSAAFFDKVKAGLDELGIQYNLNPHIVRGLDYYTHTVFEYVVESKELGVQNTVLAGGRYDGLIDQMGGQPTPAVGFAAGVERLALIASETREVEPIAIVAVGEIAQMQALGAACDIREGAIQPIEIISGTNIGKLLKKANKISASHAIIIGKDEISSGTAKIKNLTTGEQWEHDINDLGFAVKGITVQGMSAAMEAEMNEEMDFIEGMLDQEEGGLGLLDLIAMEKESKGGRTDSKNKPPLELMLED